MCIRDRAWGAESIQKVADYAAGAGIKLFVEVWNRYDTYLLNRAEQGRAFVKMVNKPNVGVMLDTFHLNIEEVDMAQAILDCKGCLYHLHVGDSNRAAQMCIRDSPYPPATYIPAARQLPHNRS